MKIDWRSAKRTLTSPQASIQLAWRNRRGVLLWAVVAAAIGVVVALLWPQTWDGVARFQIQVRDFDEEYRNSTTALPSFARLVGVLDFETPGSEFLSVFDNMGFVLHLSESTDFFDRVPDGVRLPAPPWQEGGKANAPELLRAKFQRYVKFEVEPKSGLVRLRVRMAKAAEAARWADGLVSIANEYLRNQAILRHQRNVDVLAAELAKETRSEVHKAMGDLMVKESQRLAFAQTQPDYAFVVVDPAWVPSMRSAPRRKLIVIAFFLVGAGLRFTQIVLRGD
ncbi:MAG: hypothetical protein H6693_06270 [Candidatus Latescibacteria bacterium]|nr:hypothetical protein [Candidatus Latescibacterota bacterium]